MKIKCCIECQEQLHIIPVSLKEDYYYCNNEKCPRYGLFTIRWGIKEEEDEE